MKRLLSFTAAVLQPRFIECSLSFDILLFRFDFTKAYSGTVNSPKTTNQILRKVSFIGPYDMVELEHGPYYFTKSYGPYMLPYR